MHLPLFVLAKSARRAFHPSAVKKVEIPADDLAITNRERPRNRYRLHREAGIERTGLRAFGEDKDDT